MLPEYNRIRLLKLPSVHKLIVNTDSGWYVEIPLNRSSDAVLGAVLIERFVTPQNRAIYDVIRWAKAGFAIVGQDSADLLQKSEERGLITRQMIHHPKGVHAVENTVREGQVIAGTSTHDTFGMCPAGTCVVPFISKIWAERDDLGSASGVV